MLGEISRAGHDCRHWIFAVLLWRILIGCGFDEDGRSTHDGKAAPLYVVLASDDDVPLGPFALLVLHDNHVLNGWAQSS